MQDFAMFSDEGNQAVADAVASKVARIKAMADEGFVATEQVQANAVNAVQEEVEAQGFMEVGDTAVREAIWAAVEDAAGVTSQ